MAGGTGHAIGIDMTPAMVEFARAGAREAGLTTVEVHEGLCEHMPLRDGSIDVVIANGVIDLVPEKDMVFAEIWRVLRTGGRVQIADVVIHRPVPEQGRRNTDLRSGSVVGALLEGEHARRLLKFGFVDIRQGELVDVCTGSSFNDTRRRGEKYYASPETPVLADRLRHRGIEARAFTIRAHKRRGRDAHRPGGDEVEGGVSYHRR
jgi:arsenite methyltransferase